MDVMAASQLSLTSLLVSPASSSASSQLGASVRPPLAASCHLYVLGHANGVTVLGGRMLEKSSSSALAKSIHPPALQHWHQQLRRTRRTGGRLSVAAADGAVALEVAAEETSEAAIPIEKRYPAFPAVLDINAIRNILPHRFPFLLVDRVIEYSPGVSAVAIKNVTINDNFFPGHFPDRPIMPGVLMVEALAQVGGIVMLNPEVGGSKENFFFAGVDKVRFRKPVIAGDTLVMRMTLVKLQKRFGIAKMEGKAYVGGEVVCDGEFLMALGSEG